MKEAKEWLKGCALILGLLLAGWATILAIGYFIFRGILSFMALYDHD